MTLQERIRTVVDELQEQGVDQVMLAKVAGVTKGTVNQWLTGDIKSIKLEYALPIQKRFGYSAIWLVLDDGPRKIGDTTNEAANRGRNTPLSDEANSLIRCVIRLDKDGDPMRETFAYTLGIFEIVERLRLMQDAEVVAELAKQEQLLASHADPTRVVKHAPNKHK